MAKGWWENAAKSFQGSVTRKSQRQSPFLLTKETTEIHHTSVVMTGQPVIWMTIKIALVCKRFVLRVDESHK